MFDLEQAIAEWRQRMRAAGIQSPVPLEELESHLREEMERLRETGLSDPTAFDAAVREMGEAGLLTVEFARAGGLSSWFGNDRATRIHRILGVLWVMQCLWYGSKLLLNFAQGLPFYWLTWGMLALVLGIAYELAGMVGGIYLFRGSRWGRSTIRLMAAVGLLLAIVQISVFRMLPVEGGILSVFNVITLWLLIPPPGTRLATK